MWWTVLLVQPMRCLKTDQKLGGSSLFAGHPPQLLFAPLDYLYSPAAKAYQDKFVRPGTVSLARVHFDMTSNGEMCLDVVPYPLQGYASKGSLPKLSLVSTLSAVQPSSYGHRTSPTCLVAACRVVR